MATIPRKVEWSRQRTAQPDALHMATLDSDAAMAANALAYRMAPIVRSWTYPAAIHAPYATITTANTWTTMSMAGAVGTTFQLPWYQSPGFQRVQALAQVTCSFPDARVRLRLYAGDLVTAWGSATGRESDPVAFTGGHPFGEWWEAASASDQRPHSVGSVFLDLALPSISADRRVAISLQAKLEYVNSGTPYGGMTISRRVYLNHLILQERHDPVVPT